MNTFLLHLSLWISLSKWNSSFFLASELHFEDVAFLFSYAIKTCEKGMNHVSISARSWRLFPVIL